MLGVSFEPHSLLFGESCLWLFTFFLIPFQFWPDLKSTKTRTVFDDTPATKRLIINLVHARGTQIVQTIFVYATTLVQTIYLASSLIYASTVQESYLIYLGKRNQEELAYKCLYYTPLLVKFATSVTLIVSYAYRSKYVEWKLLDHSKVFSVDPLSQLRIMLCCVLIVLPDCVRLWVDMLFLISSLRSNHYNLLQFTLLSRETNLIFLALAMVVNTSSAVVLYKPVVIIIYSEICLATHLKLLHNQLLVSCDQTAAGSKKPQWAADASTWIAAGDRQQKTLNEPRHTQRLWTTLGGSNSEVPDSSMGARPVGVRPGAPAGKLKTIEALRDSNRPESASLEVHTVRAPPGWSQNKEGASELSSPDSRRRRRGLPLGALRGDTSERAATKTATATTATTATTLKSGHSSPIKRMTIGQVSNATGGQSREVGASCSGPWPEPYQITSLFEFEKHLTQLYLFVSAIDQQTPAILFATMLINLTSVFYSILFLREMPAAEWNWFYSALFLTGPALPVVAMFWWGHAIEQQCNKITTLIEVFHFQNNSQLLLYKQLKDSQYSLTRIFRLLEQVRFSCDHLMALNMRTFKMLVLYIISGVFIVIQYDLLLATRNGGGDDDDAALAPDLGAPTTSNETLISRALNLLGFGRRDKPVMVNRDEYFRPNLFS